MSVDTRTPRSPSGGRSPGFDDDVLNTVRVPSDPAQVIVNHASFRVQTRRERAPAALRRSTTPRRCRSSTSVRSAAEARTAAGGAPRPSCGRGAPNPATRPPPNCSRRYEARGHATSAAGHRGAARERTRRGPAQVAPRWSRRAAPMIGGPPPAACPQPSAPRPAPAAAASRDAGGAYSGRTAPGRTAAWRRRRRRVRRCVRRSGGGSHGDAGRRPFGTATTRTPMTRRAAASRSGAAASPSGTPGIPGRRMNLGVVLLPLRVFLGFICVYAGLGKLCDPVYFDGGERGSMVTVARLAAPLGGGRTAARRRARAPRRRRAEQSPSSRSWSAS